MNSPTFVPLSVFDARHKAIWYVMIQREGNEKKLETLSALIDASEVMLDPGCFIYNLGCESVSESTAVEMSRCCTGNQYSGSKLVNELPDGIPRYDLKDLPAVGYELDLGNELHQYFCKII